MKKDKLQFARNYNRCNMFLNSLSNMQAQVISFAQIQNLIAKQFKYKEKNYGT